MAWLCLEVRKFKWTQHFMFIHFKWLNAPLNQSKKKKSHQRRHHSWAQFATTFISCCLLYGRVLHYLGFIFADISLWSHNANTVSNSHNAFLDYVKQNLQQQKKVETESKNQNKNRKKKFKKIQIEHKKKWIDFPMGLSFKHFEASVCRAFSEAISLSGRGRLRKSNGTKNDANLHADSKFQ